jgi:predicted nucleotidyltransferase
MKQRIPNCHRQSSLELQMDRKGHNNLIGAIVKILSENDRILFAYLYGSTLSGCKGNDIDIAVYTKAPEDPHQLSADLKIALHKETGLAPDAFDVRILNDVDERADVFGLLYLKNVLEGGQVLVDKEPDVRTDFLERYGLRFRECEGLIQEVLA